MKQFRHRSQNISQTSTYANVNSSVKVYEKIFTEIEPINFDQSNEFQKLIDLIKKEKKTNRVELITLIHLRSKF